MATRLLITDAQGLALFALDGHHGARHAAEWAAATMAQLADQGIDAMLMELHPSEGGDYFRRDTLEQIGRIRVEFHERPDGKREVSSLARFEPRAGESVASVGVGRGLSLASSAAPASDVRCAVRIVHAPSDVHGDRHAIRVPRGRQNAPPELPRTIDEIRRRRRASVAAERVRAIDESNLPIPTVSALPVLP